jgi:hypothetical protein
MYVLPFQNAVAIRQALTTARENAITLSNATAKRGMKMTSASYAKDQEIVQKALDALDAVIRVHGPAEQDEDSPDDVAGELCHCGHMLADHEMCDSGLEIKCRIPGCECGNTASAALAA